MVSDSRIATWIGVKGEDYEPGKAFLNSNLDQLRDEIDQEVELFDDPDSQQVSIRLARYLDVEASETIVEQTEWFCEYLNRFVNAIRPKIRDVDSYRA